MEKLDNKARVIQEVATQLGWGADVDSLIERVKQIDKGLVCEDEFIYLLNWLPNCVLVNKLDQSSFPDSKSNEYIIPDLSAVFEIDGKKEKFLIEVKTSKKSKLDWSENYVRKLKAYAELVDMPILVAWKCQQPLFVDWILVALDDFRKPNKNYKLNFLDGLKLNCLSKYARDYVTLLPENFGFELSLKKDKHISTEEDGETWDVFLDGLKIIGREVQGFEKFSAGLFAVFLCLGLKEKVKVTDTHIIRTWNPINKGITIQQVLLILNRVFAQGEISWLELIQQEKYPITYETLYNDLAKGIDDGIVNHILFTVPNKE